MTEIQWTLYPYVAELEHAKAWLGIQKKLLRAPNTIDAYARGLDDFLSVCERFAVRAESATKGDVASYVEEMACRPRTRVRGSWHRYGTVGLANKTMQQRLTAVRLFYDYLMETGIRDSNPVGRGALHPRDGFQRLARTWSHSPIRKTTVDSWRSGVGRLSQCSGAGRIST
jgi:site-specific recombinase XerD